MQKPFFRDHWGEGANNYKLATNDLVTFIKIYVLFINNTFLFVDLHVKFLSVDLIYCVSQLLS